MHKYLGKINRCNQRLRCVCDNINNRMKKELLSNQIKCSYIITLGRVTGKYFNIIYYVFNKRDRKSTRLNSSHIPLSRMPSSA